MCTGQYGNKCLSNSPNCTLVGHKNNSALLAPAIQALWVGTKMQLCVSARKVGQRRDSHIHPHRMLSGIHGVFGKTFNYLPGQWSASKN